VTSYSLGEKDKAGVISEPVSHHQHEGSSLHPQRQSEAHAHSIYASPDNRFVYSADLGMDQVVIYKLDQATGKLEQHSSVKTPAGGGVRHMAFSPSGDKLYVLNEFSISVSEFTRDATTGELKLLRTMPVLKEIGEKLSCSEIQLSADGKFLYAAIRDLDEKGRDGISVLDTATLEIIQEHPVGVSIPRHFGISPSGKWMLIAGQRGNEVNVHKRDPETGKLAKTEASVELNTPMWILFPGPIEVKKK